MDREEHRCCFCGRSIDEVGRLVCPGEEADCCICDGCIWNAAGLLEEEGLARPESNRAED